MDFLFSSRLVTILAGFALLGVVACASGSPSPIEEIGGNWIRINGTPSGNNPFIEIGCVVTAEEPTLTFIAGNDVPISQFYWRVNIGEWKNESAWEHLPALILDRHTGMPPRPLDFDIFRQMVNSDAGKMTITMDETYTFPLTDDIKAELRTRYPENCYTEPVASVPTATPEPTPTPTPEPTPTPAWRDWKPSPRPTSTPASPPGTPLPPVDVLSDCIGCPVIVPGEKIGTRSHQPVMTALRNRPDAKHHPDKVIVVGCYKGYYSDGLGYIMGARGSVRSDDFIAVTPPFHPKAKGQCYAITAKYWGVKKACVEYADNSCAGGIGRRVDILQFRGVGESIGIPKSRYDKLLQYARQNEYQLTTPTP